MDDFLVRAALAGTAVAVAAGPMGSFLVWRRMAYFGDALTHSALLGVALGIVLGTGTGPGIILACTAMAALLSLLQRQRALADDTLLGILAHGSLSLGVVALALLGSARYDLHALLFGDILVVTDAEVAWIWAASAGALGTLALLWRPLLRITVHEDLARAEGVRVALVRFAFTVLMAALIAAAIKVVGVLLVTSLLIIPAAAARRFAATPEQMAVGAAAAGVAAVAGGLAGSVVWDTPSGPSIVIAALAVFGAAFALPARVSRGND